MKTVRDILREQMHAEAYCLFANESVLTAAQFMDAKNLGALPVVDGNRVIGMISERDMLKKILGPGLDPRYVTVEKIMTHNFVATFPEESVETCLAKMRKARCRHLPVLENGGLIGTISLRDILGTTEAEFLDNYLWNIEGRREHSIAGKS